jgi:hypothetical protein
MKKAGTLFLVLMLSLLGVALNVAALTAPIGLSKSADRASWQYAVETGTDVVRLVIRDQADQVGAYRAVFVITAPDKQQYRFAKKGSGNSALAVAFPNDFGARWTKGTYTWTCSVGERQLLQGSFEYCKECQIRLLQANFSPERSSGR